MRLNLNLLPDVSFSGGWGDGVPQVNNFEQGFSLDHNMLLAGGPQVKKFEQVSSFDHQMSLKGDRAGDWGSLYDEGPGLEVSLYGGEGSLGQGEACTVRSNAPWVMFTQGPLLTDTHMWKHYLPVISLAGNNE